MAKLKPLKLIRDVLILGAISAGLILWFSASLKDARADAVTEVQIAALNAGIESYRVDHNGIPLGPASLALLPEAATQEQMRVASLELYKVLSGDHDLDRQRDPDQQSYFIFKPAMLRPAGGSGTVTALIDPYGDPYGYATTPVLADSARSKDRTEFYLWSVRRRLDKPQKWIKNW